MSSELVRVGLVYNGQTSLLARVIQAVFMASLPMSSLVKLLTEVLSLSEPLQTAQVSAIATQYGLDEEKMETLLRSGRVDSILAQHSLFSSSELGLKEGENALLCNGKVICIACCCLLVVLKTLDTIVLKLFCLLFACLLIKQLIVGYCFNQLGILWGSTFVCPLRKARVAGCV